MNSLLWDMYVIHRKLEFYIKMYPRFYLYRFLLFCNDFFNRKIYFRDPLPELVHLGQRKELNRLAKLDTSTRIRYLRFHAYDWLWKWKIALLNDYSGETAELQKIYDEINATVRYLAKYYYDLWQKEEEILKVLKTEQIN